MGMLDKTEMPRKVCPVIILADKSRSMEGTPIGEENAALEGILPELSAMNDANPDAIIKLGILAFSTSHYWVTGNEGLVDPKNIEWKDLTVDGATSLGAAFSELDDKLSVSHGFMKEASGSMSPALILISDGGPTDNYKMPLEKLKENNWFKVGAKVAIGYGEANDTVLEEFTGTKETVLHTNDPKELMKLIQFVAITSSMVVSKGKQIEYKDESGNVSDDTTKAVAKALREAQPDLSNAVDPDEKW